MMRGTGDIETDFLKGEIVPAGAVARGRCVRANEIVQDVGDRLVRESLAPGAMTMGARGVVLADR